MSQQTDDSYGLLLWVDRLTAGKNESQRRALAPRYRRAGASHALPFWLSSVAHCFVPLRSATTHHPVSAEPVPPALIRFSVAAPCWHHLCCEPLSEAPSTAGLGSFACAIDRG